MAETKTAVIIGVGPSEGLGAYIAKAAAADGLHIIVAGRTAEVIEASPRKSGRAGPKRPRSRPMRPTKPRLAN